MKTPIRFLICASIVAIIAGCGLTEDRTEAAQTAAAFYESVMADDISGILVHISPEFLRETPEEIVRLIFPAIKDSLGTLKSYELTGWHVDKQFGDSPLTGTFVSLQYKVMYSDTPLSETLILHRLNSDESFKIISYNFKTES